MLGACMVCTSGNTTARAATMRTGTMYRLCIVWSGIDSLKKCLSGVGFIVTVLLHYGAHNVFIGLRVVSDL